MNLTRNDFDAALRLIESAESIVITLHARPDPDAIGSALALARGLRQRDKRVVVLSQDPVPEACEYLPDAETVINTTPERDFDLGIICDADGLGRIGSAREALESAKSLLIVDHHVATRVSDFAGPVSYLVDRTAAATAEIVFELLHQLHVLFDRQIAMQLMCGIVGDTGSFRFANVTPQILEIASRLMSFGASPSEAAREIYENRSLVSIKLLGSVLFNVQVSDDGQIAWSVISHDDFVRLGASDADTDSIVNYLRGIKGTKAAVLFRETNPGVVRVSLRSRDGIDMNRVAQAFGGGGHVAAAGCTIEASLEDAVKSVLAEVRECMAS
jgi:phosphoesterase RecJ-like protein